jgi:hypothetical protein
LATSYSVFRVFTCVLLAATVDSCALIRPSRSIQVINQSGTVESVDLTPRHYKSIEHCEAAIAKIPTALEASLRPLTDEQRKSLRWPAQIAGFKVSDCRSFKKRGQILSVFDEIFSSKTKRIAFLLPPSGGSEPALQTILEQVRREFRREGYNPESAILVRRAERTRDDALRVAAHLVHLDRVALIVGGLSPEHAGALNQISDQTQTPVLMLSANAPLGNTIQSMRVYPPLKRLATKLVDTFKAQGVRETFVFYPQNANLELFHLMRGIPNSNISYSERTYNPEKSDSILAAVKSQLGRIGTANGRPAVLILDNFRMVRHIVNIIGTSLPGTPTLFAGNQQWRSPALVVPRDDLLQGAIFVDFIGSYRNLPDRIETPISDSEFFTTAQAASRIDYQIIGHRLASLSLEATKFAISRHEVANRLQTIRNSWDSYFPKAELAFDHQRESSWPVFMFEINGETIREL